MQQIPNTLRTSSQSVGTGGAVIDLSFLDAKDEVISITLIPENADQVTVAGVQGDFDYPLPADGYSYFISFRPNKTSDLPFLKAVAGTETVYIKVATKRR